MYWANIALSHYNHFSYRKLFLQGIIPFFVSVKCKFLKHDYILTSDKSSGPVHHYFDLNIAQQPNCKLEVVKLFISL